MSQGMIRGEQKTQPCNEWESLALAAYEALGLPCLWMPEHCSFDYVVNGHRIDVKGANPRQRDNTLRASFAILDGEVERAGQRPVDRCDFFHLIVKNLSNRPFHFIVPSTVVNDMITVSFTLEPPSRRWFRYLHAWQQIGGRSLQADSSTENARDRLGVPMLWPEYQNWLSAGGAITGSELRRAMTSLGLRAADLAELTGYKPDYIYKLVSCWRDRPIGSPTVRKLNQSIVLLACGEELKADGSATVRKQRERAAAPAPEEVAPSG